jgi:hypothetical protein
MSDSDPAPISDASSSASVFHWLRWSLLLLVCYVLSIVPVGKFCGSSLPSAFWQFYAPLGFLYDHVPAVHSFYDWYGKLWGVDK